MTGDQRREQLLEVGLALFAARGYDGASVEEVALRAGVSKPVVYDHFGGKDGLYAVVVEREVADLLARFSRALSGDSPRALLEQATGALLGYVEDRADGFRVLARQSPTPFVTVTGGAEGLATVLSDVGRRVEHLLARHLTGRGHRTALAGLYAQALVGQGTLVGQWWLDHPEHDREEVAASLVALAWNGLSGLEVSPRPAAAADPRP